MSDQALSGLYVELSLDQVNFEKGCDTARTVASKTAGDIDKSFSSITESRHGLMLTEEALGFRLPRALNSLLSKIPAVSSAFSAILPLAGVAVAIELIVKLIQHHQALKDEMEATRKAWQEVDDVSGKALFGMGTKLLEVQKSVDELHGNHLAVLRDELQLIDRQTLVELDKQFDGLVKAADKAFDTIKVGWLQTVNVFFGADNPAKEAKKDFDEWAESWNESGKSVDALQAKLDSLYEKQDRAKHPASRKVEHSGQYGTPLPATVEPGIVNQEQVNANQREIDTLLKLHAALTTVNQDRDAEKNLAGQKENKRSSTEGDKGAEAAIAGNKKIEDADVHLWEARQLLGLSGQKTTADIEDQITAIRLEATKRQNANDLAEANAHLTILQGAFVKDAAAIKTAQDAIVALTANQQAKLLTEQAAGNDKRFHAQEAADTQRMEMAKKIGEETLRFEEEVAKLKLAADDAAAAHRFKLHQTTDLQVTAEDVRAENAQYAGLVAAMQKEATFLDKNDKDYAVKQLALDNKMEVEAQRHQNKLTEITDKGEEARKLKVYAAEATMVKSIADSTAKSIVYGQNLADSMKHLGQQMLADALAHMMEHLLMHEAFKLKEQAMDAGTAAVSAFKWVMADVPFPVNAVLAPIAAAAAFASIMAFNEGGIVPADSMAMVHKNEMVLPAALSRGLQGMITNRNAGGGTQVHMHIQTPDADSFRASQHQIQAQMHRAISTSARRNN